jgi:hypothetical protein
MIIPGSDHARATLQQSVCFSDRVVFNEIDFISISARARVLMMAVLQMSKCLRKACLNLGLHSNQVPSKDLFESASEPKPLQKFAILWGGTFFTDKQNETTMTFHTQQKRYCGLAEIEYHCILRYI